MASGSSSGRARHLSLALTATLSRLTLLAFTLSFLPLTRPWTRRIFYYQSPIYGGLWVQHKVTDYRHKTFLVKEKKRKITIKNSRSAIHSEQSKVKQTLRFLQTKPQIFERVMPSVEPSVFTFPTHS
jgi:hypothetical protein